MARGPGVAVWLHSKYSSQRQETSKDRHGLLPASSHSVPVLIVSVSDSTPMDLQQSFTDCLVLTKLASSNLIGWIFWSKDKQVFVCLFISAWKQSHVYKVPGYNECWRIKYHWICQGVRFCLVNWISKSRLVHSALFSELHLLNSLYFMIDRVGYTVHLFLCNFACAFGIIVCLCLSIIVA